MAGGREKKGGGALPSPEREKNRILSNSGGCERKKREKKKPCRLSIYVDKKRKKGQEKPGVGFLLASGAEGKKKKKKKKRKKKERESPPWPKGEEGNGDTVSGLPVFLLPSAGRKRKK